MRMFNLLVAANSIRLGQIDLSSLLLADRHPKLRTALLNKWVFELHFAYIFRAALTKEVSRLLICLASKLV